MKLTPIRGKVIIEAEERKARTSGIIAVPSTETTQGGRIGRIVATSDVSVAEDGTEHPTEAVVGEYALFAKYGADVISAAGRTFYVVNERDILAVTDDQETFEQLNTNV